MDAPKKMICGLQQIGIGVQDVYEAWGWYKKYFGYDVRMFEERGIAELMLPYTGGQPQKRHAAFALNLQGGGGFEIWQYTERTPEPPKFDLKLGDLGIYCTKIRCKDVKATFEFYKTEGLEVLGEVQTAPDGTEYFFVKDPLQNIFQIIHADSWFKNEGKLTGSTYGAILGVSNIDESLILYSGILGYNEIVYDQTSLFEDFKSLNGSNRKLRRVLLSPGKSMKGAFSPVLGTSQIELVQAIDSKEKRKIYEGRLWGDLGFIHLCFDIIGMAMLREECQEKGFPFTVDTGDSFDMGESAGAFSYIEDPDGTLIEFVETHKVPIIKKLGWYLNLRKRNPEKPLPRWMLMAMGLNRVKGI